jgi:hypothetical protein
MNKNVILLLCFVAGLSSCSSLNELTKFEMSFSESVTIKKDLIIPNSPAYNISTPEIKTNSDDFFSTNNINTDLIEKISLKEMRLDILSPGTGNLNFLKSISISISADSLPEMNISSLNEIPAEAGTYLILTVDQTDLKQYIMKDNCKLKIKIVADETIPSDYTIDLKPQFLIIVKVTG